MNTKFQVGDKVVAIEDRGTIFRKGDVGEVTRHDDDGTVRVSWPSHPWWTEETAVVKYDAGLAPAKLTLPIVVGKKYVRRDGEVIAAELITYEGGQPFVALVLANPGANPSPSNTVYKKNGRVWFHQESPFDLVSDYIEPAKGHPHAALMMEFAKDAQESEAPWLGWELDWGCDKWATMDSAPVWNPIVKYRRKRTVTPDPHAENAAEYAKDMALSDKAWEGWEWRMANSAYSWNQMQGHPSWEPELEYQRRPV